MCKEILFSGLSQEFSFKTLEKNLEVLSGTQLKLVQRICWPIDGSHIIFDDDKVTYKLHSSEFSLSIPNDQLVYPSEVLEKENVVFVFGIGLGEQIDFLLEQFSDRKIMVWDRDPWLVRLFLMQKDYSEVIASGNLKFFMGTDLINIIPLIDNNNVIYHPLLKEIYHNEAELLLSGVGDKRILINDGGLFVDDVAQSLKNMGYTPYYLGLNKVSIEEIEYAVIQFMPSIIFSINYQNGLSDLCKKFSIKLICWEIDPSIDVPELLLEKNEKAHIFTYRKKNINDFTSAGFENVHYLPLASNIEKRRPAILSEEEKARYMCPVSFVGSSMVRQAKIHMQNLLDQYGLFRQYHGISDDEAMIPFMKILELQRLDFSTYRIPDLAQEYLKDFLQFLKVNAAKNVDPIILLAETAASEKRLMYLSRLGRYEARVWGDEDWQKAEGDGLRYMGFAGHKYELNKIYSASTINIDINRPYQADMVNMRVFDIMACGGFVIAEHSKDLSELFEVDYEVVTFKTLSELLEKVEYYLSNADEAREVACRGNKAVRERHTIQARVKHMLNMVSEKS